MITGSEIPEYRKCDLSSCDRPASWEFTVHDRNDVPRRVFVCADHQVEGFLRVRELA